MRGLQDFYGKIKGEETYLELKEENASPYRKGMRTARAHGHVKEYVPKYVDWKKK